MEQVSKHPKKTTGAVIVKICQNVEVFSSPVQTCLSFILYILSLVTIIHTNVLVVVVAMGYTAIKIVTTIQYCTLTKNSFIFYAVNIFWVWLDKISQWNGICCQLKKKTVVDWRFIMRFHIFSLSTAFWLWNEYIKYCRSYRVIRISSLFILTDCKRKLGIAGHSTEQSLYTHIFSPSITLQTIFFSLIWNLTQHILDQHQRQN